MNPPGKRQRPIERAHESARRKGIRPQARIKRGQGATALTQLSSRDSVRVEDGALPRTKPASLRAFARESLANAGTMAIVPEVSASAPLAACRGFASRCPSLRGDDGFAGNGRTLALPYVARSPPGCVGRRRAVAARGRRRVHVPAVRRGFTRAFRPHAAAVAVTPPSPATTPARFRSTSPECPAQYRPYRAFNLRSPRWPCALAAALTNRRGSRASARDALRPQPGRRPPGATNEEQPMGVGIAAASNIGIAAPAEYHSPVAAFGAYNIQCRPHGGFGNSAAHVVPPNPFQVRAISALRICRLR